MTVTVFGYLILISRDFVDFISLFSSNLVLVSTEKIYPALKTVFDHISSKFIKKCVSYF